MAKQVNKLKYSFIRVEDKNTYTLFLEARPELFGKEFDIFLNSDFQLVLDGEQIYISDRLPPDLYTRVSESDTDVFFVDHLIRPLLHQKFPPIEIRK